MVLAQVRSKKKPLYPTKFERISCSYCKIYTKFWLENPKEKDHVE